MLITNRGSKKVELCNQHDAFLVLDKEDFKWKHKYPVPILEQEPTTNGRKKFVDKTLQKFNNKGLLLKFKKNANQIIEMNSLRSYEFLVYRKEDNLLPEINNYKSMKAKEIKIGDMCLIYKPKQYTNNIQTVELVEIEYPLEHSSFYKIETKDFLVYNNFLVRLV
jgi:hypothetical protein